MLSAVSEHTPVASDGSSGLKTYSSYPSKSKDVTDASTNRSGTAKKITLSNFDRPSLPGDYLDDTWSKLKIAVLAIQQSKPISVPLDELYRTVSNVCTVKMATKLYANLETLCVKHVRSGVDVFIESNMDSLTFLKLMSNYWQDHCRQMVSIRVFLEIKFMHFIRTILFIST